MKNLLSLFIIVGLMSCSKEDEVEYAPQIAGYYKVISVQSDTGVDLNNDGIKTKDVLYELAGPHTTVDGKQVAFVDFNSSDRFLKIWPLPETPNSAKFIAFNFPSQYIDYLSDETPFLMMYLSSFINYSYKLSQESNSIHLINNNPSFDEKGSLTSLKMLNTQELELTLTKQVFDFVERDWVEVNLTVAYKKEK